MSAVPAAAPTAAVPTPRIALLAGSSGLVGRALLGLLLDAPQYREVHALLRRPVAGLPSHAKLSTHLVDYDALHSLPPADDVYIALGTTLKTAGSQDAFRRVDFDAVLNLARAARAQGATRLAVVSALGADARSGVFYNRVKGEMEQAVAGLGYPTVVFAQPSLLMGDRAALGQPTRFAEDWARRALGPVMKLLPAAVRPIGAQQVAQAMVRAMTSSALGLQRMRSAAMQTARD